MTNNNEEIEENEKTPIFADFVQFYHIFERTIYGSTLDAIPDYNREEHRTRQPWAQERTQRVPTNPDHPPIRNMLLIDADFEGIIRIPVEYVVAALRQTESTAFNPVFISREQQSIMIFSSKIIAEWFWTLLQKKGVMGDSPSNRDLFISALENWYAHYMAVGLKYREKSIEVQGFWEIAVDELFTKCELNFFPALRNLLRDSPLLEEFWIVRVDSDVLHWQSRKLNPTDRAFFDYFKDQKDNDPNLIHTFQFSRTPLPKDTWFVQPLVQEKSNQPTPLPIVYDLSLDKIPELDHHRFDDEMFDIIASFMEFYKK